MIKVDSYGSQILAHGQWWPSIEQMTRHYAPEAKAMCQKVAESGKIPMDFLLAVYSDYRMSVL